MKIERVIAWFDKESELMIGERNVDLVDLEILKRIFRPASDDPFKYNPSLIDQEKADELKGFIDIEFELDRYDYQLDCFQV